MRRFLVNAACAFVLIQIILTVKELEKPQKQHLQSRVIDVKEKEEKKVLAIWMGQLRGGEMAWSSFTKHVLRPLNADFAMLVSNETIIPFLLEQDADYIWRIPEYENWGDALELEREAACPWMKPYSWFLKTDSLFGGVANETGSGAIQLAHRAFLKRALETDSVYEKYDWFIVTRTDYIYACDLYPRVWMLNSKQIHVPVGQDYGGFTDRHLIAHRNMILKALNVTTSLVCAPNVWREMLNAKQVQNIEATLQLYWNSLNISVNEFPSVMFTVRADEDATRWSQGEENDEVSMYDLKLKYFDEFIESKKTCGVNFSFV